ncbi:hypothetical protein F4779DRAFT_638840 [Xylariaceae sp. FL0662B]|nr:hypothetical protein F4779DRAFT_638840 [Xylariaceae sp. FL0662B]
MDSIKPWPFNYYDDDIIQNLPILSDDDFDDITAVLKSLARGAYPRLDAVPTALNAYNCNRPRGCLAESWAYFHPVTIVTPLDKPLEPRIYLPGEIASDLGMPWHSVKGRAGCPDEPPGWPAELARYRFLCFIHKHRVDRRGSSQRGVHTISIWDREWDELTWHDPYHHERSTRRDEIKRFWQRVDAPDLVGRQMERRKFLTRIRYRTVYHTCSLLEDTLRHDVPPRHSLWAVMAIAVHHMNNVHDPQVSIVPDRPEFFGGSAAALLPQLFAHLLRICLMARVPAAGWGSGEHERYVRQFKILERLPWMRARTRKHLEAGAAADGDDGRSSDESGGDGNEGSLSWNWVYDALKI